MRSMVIQPGNAMVGWEGPRLLPPRADPYYVGLEQALLDSFKRDAQAAAVQHMYTPGVGAVAYLRLRGGRTSAVPYAGDGDILQDRGPLRQWWDRITKAEENFGRWEFAALLIFDRRYQPPQSYVHAYALSPAIVGPLRDLETKVGAWPKENEMQTYGDYVGAANDGSYPEIAALAVRDASQQNPSLAYGYFRAPVDGVPHQRIYLFHTLDDARGWFMSLVHSSAQPYDYVAVFAVPDLSQPVVGLESFGHALAAAQVGGVLPFLLGLPLGALGGYFYRGWREQNPGRWIPGLPANPALPAPSSVGGPWLDLVGGPWVDVEDSYGAAPFVGGPWLDIEDPSSYGPSVGGPWVDMEDPYSYGPSVGGPWVDMEDPYSFGPSVGGPWVDVEDYGAAPFVGGPWLDIQDPYSYGPSVGGPWVDLLGAEVDDRERRRAWPQTRGLIESAKREVLAAQARNPAGAWIWVFDVSEPPPGGRVFELTSTQLTPFSSLAEAEPFLYQQLQVPHIALALFDTRDRHWPNPVRWTKSDDPGYASLIAQRVAEYAPTRTAGDYSSREGATIGSALRDVRDRAKDLANRQGGRVVGVIHTTVDGLWHARSFIDEDWAEEWLHSNTEFPDSFTYAAYFNKNSRTWPEAVIDKVGGFRAAPRTARASGGYNWRAA